jgi:hypothetical protein
MSGLSHKDFGSVFIINYRMEDRTNYVRLCDIASAVSRNNQCKGNLGMKITKKLAKKVLETVDAGLCSGVGEPVPGQMCIEAAVCFALGEPHGDEPSCVAETLRAFKIQLNDTRWSSNEARALGLRRVAIAQLGSKGRLNDKIFIRALAKLARKWAPDANAAADAAAHAAADVAAAAAAAAAAHHAANAARDKCLAKCAEDVVQLLISLDIPGCKWLSLTEV